jgi:hypothetical protein
VTRAAADVAYQGAVERRLGGGGGGRDHVVDVGEVAALGAVAVDDERLALDIMDVVGTRRVWYRGLPNGLSAHTSRRYRPHVR